MFFVLSGFLIVDILRRQREKIENSGSTFLREWKRFVFRRAYRIFPVYFLFLAIIIPVATILGNQGIDIKAVIMHIFYLVNIWVNFVFRHWNQTTTHLWSLSVEEQFYVLFPILALKTPSNKLPIICLVIIILWLVTRAFFFVTRTWFMVSSYEYSIDIFSLIAFSYISWGWLFFLLFANRTPLNGCASTLSAAFLATYVAVPLLINQYGSPFAIFIIQDIPMTILILTTLVIIQRNQSSLFVKALEFKPLRALGVVSYGFYVYHVPLCVSTISWLSKFDFTSYLSQFEIYVVNFVLPLVAAILSWRFIEKPILERRPSVHDGPHELPSSTTLTQGKIIAP